MSSLPTLYRPPTPSGSGWRRWALIIAMLLTSLATAVAVVFLSATQVTERAAAQAALVRSVSSLLEIDQFVLNAWPALEAAAAQGDPIPLTGFPVALQFDPNGLAEGPAAVSDSIAAATASLIYDEGLGILSDAPRAFRFVSRGAAFDGTVGRLTRGGHAVATVALIVSGALAILLAMATAAQVRGLARIGAPALAIGLGATLIWLAAILAQSSFTGRAEATLDPFAADLWLIAADAMSLAVRNAAIVALASGTVAALTLIGSALVRLLEGTNRANRADRAGAPGVR